MPVFEVTNLAKSYGSLRAVKGLSFSVEKGEIFGVLGPNGAGKTSTLECALGIRVPDDGFSRILGMDPRRNRPDVFRRVGVQFQDSAWQVGIRVGEACESLACLFRPSPDWRGMLKTYGLERRINHAVESCSGGERQKLSILLACLHDPELLLLDELTTGLDPVARRETWEMIKGLRDGGGTVILSSHFMDEVEFLCDRAIVIKEGEIIAKGTVEELRELGGGRNLDEAYVNLMRRSA